MKEFTTECEFSSDGQARWWSVKQGQYIQTSTPSEWKDERLVRINVILIVMFVIFIIDRWQCKVRHCLLLNIIINNNNINNNNDNNNEKYQGA